MVKGLAAYVKNPDAVTAKPEDLSAQMESAKPPFECILAEVDNKIVGFALFFPNYSTWQGLPGLFLEDLYVQPNHRGAGIGKKLLGKLAEISRERNYGRMEWEVLLWNQLAIDFYDSLGAKFISNKKKCRLEGDSLQRL
jgi:GNAT superfamily N-acetyltransferase